MCVTNPRSPSKFSTTVIPAVGPATCADGARSTPAAAQCSVTTCEPRSSPSIVHSPARTPAAAATVALVTAPPQEIANSSVKTSSPRPGSRCNWPKTSSRKTSPNEIMSNEKQPPASCAAAGELASQPARLQPEG